MIAIINEVRGMKDVFARMERKLSEADRAIERGLKRCGHLLLRTSLPLTPIEFGTLRRSGFVEATDSGRHTKVTVGFRAAYAVFVHENLDAKHKEGTQAKFLEQPYRQLQPEFLKIMAEEQKKGDSNG